jgi:serine/threonine protein kinase
MTRSAHASGEEPPVPTDEAVLADFIDVAMDQMARGETVDVKRLLGTRPDLVPRGEQMLHDVAGLLGAAGVLRHQSQWLGADLLSLAAAAPAGGPPAEPEPLPDPFPGEFRVLRKLGAGAFGTVWLALDLGLGRRVALKTVRAPNGSLDRLREEARLLAAVRHRHVTQVYAWREAAKPGAPAAPEHYLVLQYVPGGSLADRVGREGPLPWQRAARYVADVAEGLLEVHARGIVHRDVKPANILWDEETDEAVLTDFGISARLAGAGSVGGTPFYMPPEAFRGTVSPAQDVFGLAASLFWLVTGSVPFPAPTVEQLLAQVERGLPDPEPRCTDLPAPLERLIRAGLAADPRQRPALTEFVTALRGGLNHLLADSLLLVPGPARQAPAGLRLTVSRQVSPHSFIPLATTQPPPERFLRDLRRVPAEPERVETYTGDRVRLEVETAQPGFVTVFNVGPTGNLNLLYPARPAAPPPEVAPGRPLHVLEVELTPPTGRERLFALWTRDPLPLRLDEMLSLAERGEVPGSGPYRATRDMVRVQESVRELRPEDWQAVVLELDHLAPPDSPR